MQSTNLFCWNLTSKESRSQWFRRPDKVKGECANSIPLAGCIFADIWAIQKRPYEIETGLYPSRGRTENYLDWLEMSGSRYDGGRSFRSCRGIIFRKIRKEASALVKQISTICVQDEVIRPFQHSSESEMAIHVLERNTKAHFHLLKCEDGITCQKKVDYRWYFLTLHVRFDHFILSFSILSWGSNLSSTEGCTLTF